MPDRYASQIATFRADNGYSPRVYLSVYNPQPIVTAEITAVPDDTKFFLIVDLLTGSESDIMSYARIVVRAATGEYKGETRASTAGSHTPTVIFIRESSSAYINYAVGDLVYVYPEVRMDTRVVQANETFSPEETYTDQNSDPRPRVCSGGHWAGWVDDYYSDSPAAFASVTTDGSNTDNVDPDSTPGNVTHDWNLLDAGVDFQSGSAATDESPVLEVDAGSHLVEHLVTDDDNSEVGAQYVVYMAHNAANPPYDVLLSTPPQGDVDTGWSWTVELFDDADLTSIPDGSLCILWADEWIGGTLQSFRSSVTGRSHILGIGYARRDTSAGNGDDGDMLTMEIQSPMARLNEIASYSKVMEENATPDAWNEIKTLGFQRGIVQLWQFYTTGMEAGFDFVIHSLFDDARYPAHYLQRSDPVGQMRELALARQGRIVNRERGAIFELQPDPATIAWGDRSGVTITVTLTDDDVFEYEYTREHYDSIEILELRGITAGTSGNTAVYSRAPGLAPGGGSQAATQERRAPDSQTQANLWAGLEYAKAENLFYDPDNNYKKHRVGELTLRLPGVYNFFDFNLEYVRFQYAGSLRGIDFADTRFYLKRVSMEIDADTGEAITVPTFQAETYALPGTTYVPPSDGAGIGDGQPPPFPFPPIILPPVSGTIISGGAGKLAHINNDGYIYYSTNIKSGSPTWARESLGMTGAPLDFVTNPFSPYYLTGSGNIEAWVATATRIYFLEWDPATQTIDNVTQQATLTSTSLFLRRIETERAFEGVVAVISSYAGTGTKVTTTTDGATWGAEVTLNADGTSYGVPLLHVSGKTSGLIIAGESRASVGTNNEGEVSTNNGSTFAGTLTSPNLDNNGQGAHAGHIPWHNNPTDTIAYFGYTSIDIDTSGTNKIYRVSGTTQTDISPTDGETFGAQAPHGIDTCPINRQSVVACARNGTDNASAGSDVVRVWYSTNGGDSWSYIAALDSTASAGAYWQAFSAGDDPTIHYVTGHAGRIAKITTGGLYQNLSGNLSTFSAGFVIKPFGF